MRKRLLDDPTAKLVERQDDSLLKHDIIELIDPLTSSFLEDELDDVVAKDVLHQTFRVGSLLSICLEQ